MKKNAAFFFDAEDKKTLINDTVQVLNSGDDDFCEWEENKGNCNHQVELFCSESELVWLKDCPFAVQMNSVVKIENPGN